MEKKIGYGVSLVTDYPARVVIDCQICLFKENVHEFLAGFSSALTAAEKEAREIDGRRGKSFNRDGQDGQDKTEGSGEGK